jgi:hypothetical protein
VWKNARINNIEMPTVWIITDHMYVKNFPLSHIFPFIMRSAFAGCMNMKVHSGQLAPQTTPIPKTVGKVVFVSDKCPVVLISHADLVAKKDLSLQLKAAFGVEGMGIIAVSGVPGYATARSALLPLAYR